MVLFDWSDEYSVNVLAMDNHHKKLFDMINRLGDSPIKKSGEVAIAKLITELLNYTQYHFEEEEKMLEQINYSGIESQKKAHQAFIGTMQEFKKDVDAGMALMIASKAARVSLSWLKEHILVMDKQYGSDASIVGLH